MVDAVSPTCVFVREISLSVGKEQGTSLNLVIIARPTAICAQFHSSERANSLRIRTGNSFHRTGKFHRRTGIAQLSSRLERLDAAAVAHQHSSRTDLAISPINCPDTGFARRDFWWSNAVLAPTDLAPEKRLTIYVVWAKSRWIQSHVGLATVSGSVQESRRSPPVDFKRRRIPSPRRRLGLLPTVRQLGCSCQPPAKLAGSSQS